VRFFVVPCVVFATLFLGTTYDKKGQRRGPHSWDGGDLTSHPGVAFGQLSAFSAQALRYIILLSLVGRAKSKIKKSAVPLFIPLESCSLVGCCLWVFFLLVFRGIVVCIYFLLGLW
jgi:hypothetical protein